MAKFDPTSASRAVLLEVANVLGAFRNDLVIVGGWVPELLYPDRGHIGSLDVDLAVAPTALADNVYQTILQRLLDAGYVHRSPPTRFDKVVVGVDAPIKVDLISGQYMGGEKASQIDVNALQINTLRGLDLAFEASDEIEISGMMPDGTHNVVRARIVRPEAFILIKAFALDERAKEKDAYDIAFVLECYQPNLAMLADRVRSQLRTGLGAEALQILEGKFASLDSAGPVWAARVAKGQGVDYEQARRAAFENAQDVFRRLAR
jgi:hypothetical protein